MAGLKVPTYERQTRFVSAYKGPTASPQAFGSDIGKGLTALGAGITDVGLAQMQRASQRQDAEDLNFNQTGRLGHNDAVYRDTLDNRDAAVLSSGNPTEEAQGRWKKDSEARLQELLKTYKPSRKALDRYQRDVQAIDAQYTEDHLNMVDQGRRLNIANDANKNLQLIQASAAENGDFSAQNAEQAEALAALQKVLPVADYLRVEEQARIGMGKAVVEHLVRVQDKALTAKDATEAASYKGQADALIDQAVKLGYIDGANAETTKREWRQGYDERMSKSMDPAMRRQAMGGPQASVRRGSANYMYGQFGGPGENLTTFQTSGGKNVQVHQAAAASFRGFIAELEQRGYNIKDIGSHNLRKIAGSDKWSQHAYGNAIDINSVDNPDHTSTTDLPADISDIAARHGLTWGGDWKDPDPMHFEWAGVGPAEGRATAPLLINAMIAVESTGDAGAVSLAGAIGIMQVMPGTAKEIARELGDANFPATGGEIDIRKYLSNRDVGLRYGTHYLDKMLKKYNGDTEAALIAYNGGPARADAWIAAGRDNSVLPAETAAYAGKVMAAMGVVGGTVPAPAPEGSWFTDMPADTRAAIIRGTEAEMAAGNAALKSDINDYVAFLQTGAPPDGRYPPEELNYRMGDRQGQEYSEAIAGAAAYGRQVKALEMATPAEVAAIREQKQAALATPEDFVQNQAEAAGIDKIIAARDKQIADDAGAYVADHDKDTRAAMGKYFSLPQSAPQAERTTAAMAWAVASGKAQDLLGVRKDLQRILPDKVVEDLVSKFSNQPEGGQNAYELMQGLQATWGKHWEQVFEQLATDGKLPGTALVVGVMNRPDQRLAGMTLANAAKSGTEALEKTLPPDTVRDLKETLHEGTAEFAATLAFNGDSGRTTYNTFNEAIYQLALVYSGPGQNRGDPMGDAVRDVLGRAYTFKDTYRVPIELPADTVEHGAMQFQQQIDPAELMIPPSLMGVHPDDARAAYQMQVQNSGLWVTSDNEDGLTLYDERGSAVRNVDGTPYTKTWAELTASGEAMTYPSIVGTQVPVEQTIPADITAEQRVFEEAEDVRRSAAEAAQSEPTAATDMSEQQWQMISGALSSEQASRMSRAGENWRDVLKALAGTDRPTVADVDALIADLEAKIPGNSPRKEKLLQTLRMTGQALR